MGQGWQLVYSSQPAKLNVPSARQRRGWRSPGVGGGIVGGGDRVRGFGDDMAIADDQGANGRRALTTFR